MALNANGLNAEVEGLTASGTPAVNVWAARKP